MKGVTVVMPARNAAATIGAQLAALADQDYPGPIEVVVVDSASADATATIVAEWATAGTGRRVVSADRPGAARARNLGVRAASSELILMCDADDVVASTWVSALVDALATYDVATGILDYVRLNRPEVRARARSEGLDHLPRLFGRPYAVSANLGMRRSVVDRTQGFDESFGMGAEDVDFSWRSQDCGFSLGFTPDAVVHYRLRASTRAWLRQQYSYARGESHLYAKHMELRRLPSRSRASQLRTFGGRLARLVVRLPRVVSRSGRDEVLHRAALLVGSTAGTLSGGVFI